MTQAVLAGSDFDEGAEVLDTGDTAVVDLTDLDAFRDALDRLHGPGRAFGIEAGHGDCPVVLYIDLSTRRSFKPTDALAARPDYRTYLLRIDLDGQYPGCI